MNLDWAYSLVGYLFKYLPKTWDNKDTRGAVLGFIAVALLIAIGWKAPWLAKLLFSLFV